MMLAAFLLLRETFLPPAGGPNLVEREKAEVLYVQHLSFTLCDLEYRDFANSHKE
jgi:hypothetical protein